jgi:ring-1,2-phenylacetyl-CoA epoxidase subunit PaaD
MVRQEAVWEVLRTINDPEMPISIVDLGIVDRMSIEPASADMQPPRARVVIDILPTFIGCPALPVIEDEIRKRVGDLSGVADVEVHCRFDPPWTVDRISAAGRETLRQMGITVPDAEAGTRSQAEPSRCPFCGSSAVHLESAFGPTRCRMIYYCESCRNPFEHLKKVT